MSEIPSANRFSVYKPDSQFAYVGEYDVESDASLEQIDNRRRYLQHRAGIIDTFTPRDALIRWVKESPGGWQQRQTARYPTFHRDLDPTLLREDHDTDEKITAFRLRMLEEFCRPPAAGEDSANQDFHPVGHMSRVLVTLDDLLEDGPLARIQHNPFLLDVIRHTAALHDTGEIEHPGAIIKHGGVVGDIASSKGKTAADRAAERAIYEGVIADIYGDQYSAEFREAMVKMVSHDIEGEGKEFILYHGLLEFAHHLNSVHTGQFVGKRATELVFSLSDHANFMTVLAEQSERILKPKIEEVFKHSPGLKAVLGATAANAMRYLNNAVHCRDEDPDWLKWRRSPEIIAAYGEYTPDF